MITFSSSGDKNETTGVQYIQNITIEFNKGYERVIYVNVYTPSLKSQTDGGVEIVGRIGNFLTT